MPSLLERLLGDETPDEQADLEARQERADEALREAVRRESLSQGGDGAAEERDGADSVGTVEERDGADSVGTVEDCGVTGVAVVNEGPDGEPVVVPVARFSLGEDVEDPDMDLVWDLVGVASEALAPAFEDVFVRHYDVQFTFDGDELFEAEECRRVLLTDDLVDRYAAGDLSLPALRRAVTEADDVDDRVAPVAWGEVEDYSRTSGAAVVVGGAPAGGAAAAAAAAGASASAATCAGAASGAAAGAGGGAC